MMTASSDSSWIRRLHHPRFTALFAGLLAVSASSQSDRDGSVAGRLAWSVLHGLSSHCRFPRPPMTLVKHPSGVVELHDPWGDYGPVPTLSLTSPGAPIAGDETATLTYTYFQERIGVWAVTREKTDETLTFIPENLKSFTAAEIQEVRSWYITSFRREASAIQYGDRHETRTLWWGYLHDAAALACFAGLAISLGWLAEPHRRYRELLLIKQGRCPRCEYFVGDLPERRCPECGWVAPIHEAPPNEPRP